MKEHQIHAWMACADVDMLTTLAVVLIRLRCSSPIVVPASNPKESPVRFFDIKATTSDCVMMFVRRLVILLKTAALWRPEAKYLMAYNKVPWP